MCRTPYCYGDCDDCIQDQKNEEEDREFSSDCPYKKSCKLDTIDSLTDICRNCGQIFNY